MRTGIAFGSNVGDRLDHLRRARQELLSLPFITGPYLFSAVYETEPVDTEPGSQSFLNAVAEVDFEGHPLGLLDALQQIETRFGRPSKRPRNAPRPIDLDVLYVGNLVLRNEEIVIPHPRLHMRRFVLEPLATIRPELVLPGQEESVAEALAALQDTSAVELYTEEWKP